MTSDLSSLLLLVAFGFQVWPNMEGWDKVSVLRRKVVNTGLTVYKQSAKLEVLLVVTQTFPFIILKL